MSASSPLRRRCAPRPGLVVLFDDCKHFYRSKVALDMVVAYHESYACLEVAAYHPEMERESPRVYLNLLLIRQEIPQNELDAKVLEKTEHLVRMRESRSPEDIRTTATQEMVVNYVLSRIHIFFAGAPNSSQPGGSDFAIIVGSSDADIAESPFSMQPPAGLQPANCVFQKKVSSEIYSAALTKLQDETLGLRSATTVANLIASGVEGFQDALKERRRFEKIQAQSVYKAKFMRAIHRIVIQNEVEKMRARLAGIEARQEVEAHNADLIAQIEVERIKNPLMAKRLAKGLLALPDVRRRSIIASLPERKDEASNLPALLKPMRSCPNLNKDETDVREDRNRRRKPRPLSGSVQSKAAVLGMGGRILSRPPSSQGSPQRTESLPSVLNSFASASAQAAAPSISSAQLNHKWSVAPTLQTAPR